MIELAGSLQGYIACFNILQVAAPVLVHSIITKAHAKIKHLMLSSANTNEILECVCEIIS